MVGLMLVAFSLLMVLVFAAVVLAFVFWIWMIVDCARRKFKKDSDKIVWILIILFLHILGALIYYFIVKYKK